MGCPSVRRAKPGFRSYTASPTHGDMRVYIDQTSGVLFGEFRGIVLAFFCFGLVIRCYVRPARLHVQRCIIIFLIEGSEADVRVNNRDAVFRTLMNPEGVSLDIANSLIFLLMLMAYAALLPSSSETFH